jgi:hypothetical protein
MKKYFQFADYFGEARHQNEILSELKLYGNGTGENRINPHLV